MTKYIQQISIEDLSKSTSILKNKFLLIDTSFLIDSIKYLSAFDNFLELVQQSNCSLFTIDAVLYEFTQGRPAKEYKDRIDYIDHFLEAIIPLPPQASTEVSDLSKAMFHKNAHISYTDMLLLVTLMKYSHNTYLLTKDRTDIPISLFPIVMSFAVEVSGKDLGTQNCFYSVYSFDREVHKDKLQQYVTMLKTMDKKT